MKPLITLPTQQNVGDRTSVRHHHVRHNQLFFQHGNPESQNMKLSKAQKAVLVEQLSFPYGRVQLMCDGYQITLRVEKAKGMTYRVVTYINGEWKGAWCRGNISQPEQKFLNRVERPLAKPSEKAKAEKLFGKRALAKDPWFTKKLVTYDTSWASGKSAINHLCRVCDSVALFESTGGAS